MLARVSDLTRNNNRLNNRPSGGLAGIMCTAAMLAALALAACASARPQLDDGLVVPGQRVGQIEIGMKLAELLAVMGQPRHTSPIQGTAATSYAFDGITVGAHDEVYWIIAEDPRYRTVSGVAPGAEQIYARAAMGKPDCVVTRGAVTVYDYRNAYFEVDNASGRVTRVGVQEKTDFCRS
jgi:hypothetical protein